MQTDKQTTEGSGCAAVPCSAPSTVGIEEFREPWVALNADDTAITTAPTYVMLLAALLVIWNVPFYPVVFRRRKELGAKFIPVARWQNSIIEPPVADNTGAGDTENVK